MAVQKLKIKIISKIIDLVTINNVLLYYTILHIFKFMPMVFGWLGWEVIIL